MIQRLRQLAADERGTSIIEMGLVLPVLATLMLGMSDVSRAYSHKLQLEQAAYRAIEKVQQYQTTTSTYSTLKVEAATAAGVPETDVAVSYWLECNGSASATYATNCTNGQTYARWVQVVITKKYSPLFGSRFFPGANADGSYTMYGKARLRTQ
jgi:Flp pilus assembly protein TadG